MKLDASAWRKLGTVATILGIVMEIFGEIADEHERELEIKECVQKEVQTALSNSHNLHTV